MKQEPIPTRLPLPTVAAAEHVPRSGEALTEEGTKYPHGTFQHTLHDQQQLQNMVVQELCQRQNAQASQAVFSQNAQASRAVLDCEQQ